MSGEQLARVQQGKVFVQSFVTIVWKYLECSLWNDQVYFLFTKWSTISDPLKSSFSFSFSLFKILLFACIKLSQYIILSKQIFLVGTQLDSIIIVIIIIIIAFIFRRGLDGLGHCNHIGFALEDFSRKALRENNESVACTSKLCSWNSPRNLKVDLLTYGCYCAKRSITMVRLKLQEIL